MERAVREAASERVAVSPRDAIAGRDARTLARELLAMTREEFSAAFKGSPMKRAKLAWIEA